MFYNKRKKKQSIRLIWGILLFAILGLSLTGIYFISSNIMEYSFGLDGLYTFGNDKEEITRINIQYVDGENIMIFPSNTSPDKVRLHFNVSDQKVLIAKGDAGSIEFKSGDMLDLTELCKDNDYKISLEYTEGLHRYCCEVRFVFSANIPVLYLVSEDPLREGREWVEASPDKSNKAKGNMFMQNADGSVIYHGGLTQIKGRGNTTWGYEKKPYQIKLETETDLLKTGKKDNASKTWVLLANHLDSTLMRNTIALNMGNAMGMAAGIENKPVDLYYDGEYRGCYLLSEKVEVGSGRVDVADLEKLNEDANPDTDLRTFSMESAMTYNGASYVYCDGMQSPDNITGGYLLEMDFANRAVEEPCYFYTSRGNYVVVKSPEYASREEMEYISTLYQEFEDAVYNRGLNPYNGKSYTDYVDVESIATCYLVNEFSKNRDGFVSSAYFYKNADEEILYAGPLWDYDLSLGIGGGELVEEMSPDGMYTSKSYFGAALCKIDSFKEKISEIYEDVMYPLVKDVLLGNEECVSGDGLLHSISYYYVLLRSSVDCNNRMWITDTEWKEAVEKLKMFCNNRGEFLKEEFLVWTSENYIPSVAYEDVSPDDWYYKPICKAGEYGLMVGIGGDSFEPGSYVQRAQAVQVIYNMLDHPVSEVKYSFVDVDEHHWYHQVISWAFDNGIVSGYADGTFRPTNNITKEDFLSMLYCFAGTPEVKSDSISKYQDADDVADYARNAVEWALEQKITDGGSMNRILPQNEITRAELASMIVRYYEQFMK